MRTFLSLLLTALICSTAAGDIADIGFNELLADPNGANNFDTDGDGDFETGDEFVEFINNSAAAVDVTGWELWVGSGGTLSSRFTFGTYAVNPGEVFAIVTNWDPGTPPANVFSAGSGSGIFGNGGDNFVLYDPTADEYSSFIYNADPDLLGNGLPGTATQIGATLDLGSDSDGLSIQAIPDGSTTFVNATPTPGSLNAVPEPSSFAVVGLMGIGFFVRRRRNS